MGTELFSAAVVPVAQGSDDGHYLKSGPEFECLICDLAPGATDLGEIPGREVLIHDKDEDRAEYLRWDAACANRHGNLMMVIDLLYEIKFLNA